MLRSKEGATMEFLGKIVKKEFTGHGVFSGIVKSYNASSGFFEILYEDGDSEELDFSEVASLLQHKETQPADHKHRLGRRPKKRRRVEPRKLEDLGGGESGNSNSNSHQMIVETLGRRIVEANGNFDMNRNVDLNGGLIGVLRETELGSGNFGIKTVDLNEDFEKGSGVEENIRENEYGNGSLNGNGGMKQVLDLNAGLNLNLNEGFDLNVEDGINADLHDNLKKRECIDLNLDVNGDVDENLTELDKESNHLESQKRICGFDLNLGIDEEIKDDVDGVCRGNGRQATSKEMDKETTQKIVDSIGVSERVHNEFDIENGTLQEVPVTNDSCLEFAKGMWKKDIVIGEDLRGFDSVEVQDTKTIQEDSSTVIDENHGDCRSTYREGSAGRRRGRRRLNDAYNLNVTPEIMLCADATVMYGNQNGRSVHKEGNPRRSGRRRGKIANTWNSTPETTIVEDALVVKEYCGVETDRKQGDSESACKEVSGSCRKRRRLSDNVNATKEMAVVRRSARRGSVKTDVSTTTSSALNDISASPAGSALTEEKPMKSCHGWPEESVVLPAKVQLPPSSQNLDLGGISVADFFSVYSCLRSFSTLLFLSPFELEDFVAALKCNSPSSLFDCIHVSILQMLRKHLEYLSNEGSESASNCLRSVNWYLLDLVTWPIFMVEYLLMHDSDLKPVFNLSQLKLFKNEYYKQPVSVKVEILRCLCDGMIEAEAIKTELNRRSSGAESDLDFERNMNIGTLKKRRNEIDVLGASASCLTEEAVDDTTDWNSDECCLCKMDGSLICCDGCPAAYHSKCVGVLNDSLPEGDWFCPECAIDRHKPWMKCRGSVRGAELLGVDLYGRLYFNSCDYLLVSDSCESASSFNYYHRDDLNGVIKVLRSSEMIYSSILEAVHKHWDIPVSLYSASSNVDLLNHALSLDISLIPAALASSETCRISNEIADERKPIDNCVAGRSGHTNIMASKSASQTCVSSEGSAETTQTSLENQNFPKEESNFSNRAAGSESDIPRNSPPLGGNFLSSTCLDLESKNIIGSASNGNPSCTLNGRNGGTSQVQMGTGYMNYYSFGHMASSIAEELMLKSSDKSIDNSIKTDEEIISSQMKIISKKCANFRWPYIPTLNADFQKEKCGWCFSCRVSSDDLGCLFNMCLDPVQGGSATEVVGLQSKKGKKGHLTDVISHILVIEDRLQGLLLGPWLNPHYSRLWRKSVLKAPNIESVKYLLLTLESNIRCLALSAEWLKHVDSGTKVGSAVHIIMASSRASSKNGISRKRARYSESEPCPSNSAGGLGMLWWRGGRLSRQLFSWKVLPRSLVSKAARQAGCMKIPGMLYPENSDFAKRSKYVAWRAAVESSTTTEQLALQVRELDSNIRWDEVWNTTLLSLVDKEFRKSVRLFKKAVVRRKSVEGDGTKYLLDFGKRRSIPEIVLKNGCVVEESSSERKKYWLNETYVPLYLLKSFEEKRIARGSSKISSGKLSDDSIVLKKPSKKRGFSYLFAKAERSEYHRCGHCNKNVPIRDAVCCQYCKGLFHKRHVRKSSGSITAEYTYSCHRCANGKNLKNDSRTGKTNKRSGKINNKSKKVQHQNLQKASARAVRLINSKRQLRSAGSLKSQKTKKVTVIVPLRRSPRKTKYKSLQNKKVRGRKKNKQFKPRKTTCKEPTKVTSLRKKRTQAYHSYWLKGLLLSRKPDDERVMRFRRKSFLAPSESVILGQPKCCLCCEAGYRSTSTYISCEMCGEWFHGDAFGISGENSNMLIGFRCHMCRNSAPPICPLVPIIENHGSQIPDVQIDVRNEVSGEPTNVIPQLSGINLSQESFASEVRQCSLPVDESAHWKEQLDTTMISDQCSAPESRLEADNGHLFDNVMENTDAIQGSNEHLNTDNTVEAGDDIVVITSDQMEPASCNVDVDVIVTEMGPSTCDDVRDGMVTPISKYPIDGNHNSKEKTIESSDAMITSFDQMQPASCNIGADVMVTELVPSGCESAKDGFNNTHTVVTK